MTYSWTHTASCSLRGKVARTVRCVLIGVEPGGQSSDCWNFVLGFTVKNIGVEAASLD